jgi:hypothetical protein
MMMFKTDHLRLCVYSFEICALQILVFQIKERKKKTDQGYAAFAFLEDLLRTACGFCCFC